MQQNTTESVRINKDLLEKIKYISKSRGYTISGYIMANLQKSVDRDWNKFLQKNSIHTDAHKKDSI